MNFESLVANLFRLYLSLFNVITSIIVEAQRARGRLHNENKLLQRSELQEDEHYGREFQVLPQVFLLR